MPPHRDSPNTKNAQVQTFNAAIPGLVKTRTDADKHVVTVDMYRPFTANPNFSTDLLSDGLHPNSTGYTFMANTWCAAIGPLLR